MIYMSYSPPKRLEDLDFKNISNNDLRDFIFSIDNIQGKRFGKLESDALFTARTGIIRHLMACLNMDVRPDVDTFREVIDDAKIGRAVFNLTRAQSRIDSFRKENIDTEEIAETAGRIVTTMAFKGNTKPKKVSIDDGLTDSRRLIVFIENDFHTEVDSWLQKNKQIKVVPASRAKSFGGCVPSERIVWSTVKLSEFPRHAKKQFNPKTGTVNFEFFTTGLSLAETLAEKLKLNLPESVVKRLTPPPVPIQTKQEGLSMNHAQNMMTLLPKWIFDKALPHQEWKTELARLFEYSRKHPNYDLVDLDDFTEAAFKALCGTDKVPEGALKELVFFYLRKNSIEVEVTSEQLVQEVSTVLIDHGFHKPQEAIVRKYLKEYEDGIESTEGETSTDAAQQLPGSEMAHGKTLGSAVVSYYNGVPIPDRLAGNQMAELENWLKSQGFEAERNSISAAISIARSERKQVPAIADAVPALSVATMAPADWNLKSLIRLCLAANGSFPRACPDKATLLKFVSTVLPDVKPGSFDSTLYVVRKTLREHPKSEAEDSADSIDLIGLARTSSADQVDPVASEPSAQQSAPTGVVELMVPEGNFTVADLIRANLGPDGSLPSHCATVKAFHAFVSQAMPMAYKSCENKLYAVRKLMKEEAAGLRQAPEIILAAKPLEEFIAIRRIVEQDDVVVEAQAETVAEPSIEEPAVGITKDDDEEVAASMRQLHDSLPKQEPVEPAKSTVTAKPPIKEKPASIDSSDESEELRAVREKVRRARELFTKLDENPEVLKLFLEFRDMLPVLKTFSDVFGEKGVPAPGDLF